MLWKPGTLLINSLNMKSHEWNFDTAVEHKFKDIPLKLKVNNSIKGDKDYDKVINWINPTLSF